MVAALGLFDLLQMLVELFLREERGGIQPLELGVVGVALPIGPGDREQLVRPDRLRAGHVRPAAEVDELALPIERHPGMVGQARVDVLDLVLLLEALADLQRLAARHFDPLERLIEVDDLLHLGFDRRKVFFA